MIDFMSFSPRQPSPTIVVGFVGRVFQVADAPLNLSFDLLRAALDLLAGVVCRIAERALRLARDVLHLTFDLIAIHEEFSFRMQRWIRCLFLYGGRGGAPTTVAMLIRLSVDGRQSLTSPIETTGGSVCGVVRDRSRPRKYRLFVDDLAKLGGLIVDDVRTDACLRPVGVSRN